jgi:hypothetical protein
MGRYQHTGRTEQSKAALKRLIDARKLQLQGRWRGAMYLAGYSIECKLKARLMEVYGLDTLDQLEVEVERRLGRPVNVFTHSIEALFGLTGAQRRLLSDPKRPGALRAFQQCNVWRPAWRYTADDASEDACAAFMQAVVEFGQFIDHNV